MVKANDMIHIFGILAEIKCRLLLVLFFHVPCFSLCLVASSHASLGRESEAVEPDCCRAKQSCLCSEPLTPMPGLQAP